MGAQVIDGATIFEEQTAAVRVLTDTVAVLKWIEVTPDEIIHCQIHVSSQRNDLIPGDEDGSRFTRTAGAAPLALETNTGIKKIGTQLQRIQGFPVHEFNLSDPRGRFNCNNLFT